MSKNSPITQRIQKALYMRSAAKQTNENNEDKPKTTFVDDPRRGAIVEGQMVETVVPGATTNEGLEGSYTGDNFYQGDYYSPDSPLGREMKKLGIQNITPDSIKDYEKSKLIKNRKSGNTAEFGGVKATNEAGETRDVSDEELQNISDEDIMNRNVQTQGADQIEQRFEGKDVPQEFAVMSQGEAGGAARGNRKKINTTMRNERKLGAFSNPDMKPRDADGKLLPGFSEGRWTKKEKKLYAAKLTSGADMGYGTGVGIGGQSYEGNKMVFAQNAGEGNMENQTFTNIDDPRYRTNEQINPESGDLEQKNTDDIKNSVSMYEPESTAAKMLGTTPLKNKLKLLNKARKSGQKLAKQGDDVVDATKNFEIIDDAGRGVKVEGGKVTGKVGGSSDGLVVSGKSGKTSSAGNVNFTRSVDDAAKGGQNLNKKSGYLDKAKNILKKAKPIVTYGTAAALGAGAYSMFSGGDDVKPENTNPGGGGGGGTGGGGSNNNNTTTSTTTTPKTTTGVTKVNNISRDLPVAPPRTNKVTIGDSLSTSSNRAAQREANRQMRFEGRQARKQQRLDNRQARRAQRRANPTLVGGALRRTFGGKKMDTSINNMGNYNQNDKKKNGQFGNTSRPGYTA